MHLDQILFMAMIRVVKLLTEQLFFDTDCLSAFLWVDNQSLLAQLYPGKIVIPSHVYNELSCPNTPHLKARIDSMIANKEVTVESFDVGSKMYELYLKMTLNPDVGHRVIGSGEAAGIVMAKEKDGILASNNLRDIKQYVDEFKLKHITTGDIIKEAYEKKLIFETQANQLWQDMLNKRRKLGYSSFSEFLKNNP